MGTHVCNSQNLDIILLARECKHPEFTVASYYDMLEEIAEWEKQDIEYHRQKWEMEDLYFASDTYTQEEWRYANRKNKNIR